jgi:lantibiotic transport system permease protein
MLTSIIKTEFLKSKRSASVRLTVLGSAFIPFVFLMMYIFKPEHFIKALSVNSWIEHYVSGYQSGAAFLLPMFIILITSLVTQTETKNNAWKQVYASPVSITSVVLAKFIMVQVIIISCFILFDLYMGLTAIAANIINPGYNFFSSHLDMNAVMMYSLKIYAATLAISAIQFWISLRFKNYILPLGIGMALLITGLIVMNWEYIYLYPYAYPLLTFMTSISLGQNWLVKHEYISICYTLAILILTLFDVNRFKEKG